MYQAIGWNAYQQWVDEVDRRASPKRNRRRRSRYPK
jgi:hypothetical protein